MRRFLPPIGGPSGVIEGIDPASGSGAGVVLDGLDVLRVVGWRRDRGPDRGYRVRAWSPGGPGYEDDVPTLTAVLAHLEGYDGPRATLGGVEGIGSHGRKAGAIALAESAGAAVAHVERVTGRVALRPHMVRWCPDVLGVIGTLAAEDHRRAVLGAVRGEPVAGRRTVVDWGVRVPEDVLDEHAADAIGIALWAAGYRIGGETG